MGADESANGHTPEPIKDSWYTIYGMPAELDKPWDYPVEAVCMHCGRPIRAESHVETWKHFERTAE